MQIIHIWISREIGATEEATPVNGAFYRQSLTN